MSSKKQSLQKNIAGIHLSGASSPKTSVVIMTGGFWEGNLKMLHVFDKIGSNSRVFADDRLFEILRLTIPVKLFVDSPMSEPPCVTCRRPSCPGVIACDDVGVSYMQSLLEKSSAYKKRKKPLNPQTQRLWDVKRWIESEGIAGEPTYGANMAPLVVRAKTLQRRLNSIDPAIEMQETSVPLALKEIVQALRMDQVYADYYRHFEKGAAFREEILEKMILRRWIQLNEVDRVLESVENFQAFITCFVAALKKDSLCKRPDNQFFETQGWVYLPDAELLRRR